MFHGVQKKLVAALRDNRLIRERVERLMSIAGVGELTALTWVLEVGEVERFRSVRQAVSYCGLCTAQKDTTGIPIFSKPSIVASKPPPPNQPGTFCMPCGKNTTPRRNLRIAVGTSSLVCISFLSILPSLSRI
jgi:hypothetical protein